MSYQEVTTRRWLHNHIYPRPTHTNESLRVYKQLDLPFTNFHIVYDFKIVFVTVMKFIALIFCDCNNGNVK